MGITRIFDIRRLKPFHRDGDRLPKATPDRSDELSSLDPDLRPDEQSYVNHYLNYADILLNEPEEDEDGAAASKSQPRGKIEFIELPQIEENADDETEEDRDAA